jgi:hypothetical protein
LLYQDDLAIAQSSQFDHEDGYIPFILLGGNADVVKAIADQGEGFGGAFLGSVEFTKDLGLSGERFAPFATHVTDQGVGEFGFGLILLLEPIKQGTTDE